MKRKNAVIDQLLNRIEQLEECLDLMELVLEAHELGKAELPEFWKKMNEGRKN